MEPAIIFWMNGWNWMHNEKLSSRVEAEVLNRAVKTNYASAARVLGEDS